MTTTTFQPFYDRLGDRFAMPFLAKLLASVLLGLMFLAPHFIAAEEAIFSDWSWLLCVIIIAAMLSLYYATHTLRSVFPQMDLRLEDAGRSTGTEAYQGTLRRRLRDAKFLQWGLLFAALNCLVGWVLGPKADTPLTLTTTYLGYALAGFVCGMATGGIRGVVLVLQSYVDADRPRIDYTNPDGCGGTLFLGDALVKFSAVTLLIGVLISTYILRAGWHNVEWATVATDSQLSTYIKAAMWLWIALPFVLSLTVLLAPAVQINRALMAHKISTEVELTVQHELRRAELEQRIRQVAKLDAAQEEKLQALLQADLNIYEARRIQLHRMHTWPFDRKTNVKFVGLFFGNAAVTFKSVVGVLVGTA